MDYVAPHSDFSPASRFLVIAVAILAISGALLAGCPSEPSTEFANSGADTDNDDLDAVDDTDGADEDPTDVGDTGNEDGDTAECEPQTDREFCQSHNAECGEVTAEDNCGGSRTVDCGQFEGFECGELGTCVTAEGSEQYDANRCECPDVDFGTSDEEICGQLDYDCGTFEPAERCSGWEDPPESVDCGDCEDGVDCGEDVQNVCGCPCDIDGQCWTDGDSPEDNPCLVCDSEQSETDWSDAEDGMSCGEDAACSDGECLCDEDCADQTGWYDVDDAEACCEAGESCQCQDQEHRQYDCDDDGSCTYEVTDTRTEVSNCSSCDDTNACTEDTCSNGTCQSTDYCSGDDTDCGCSQCIDCTAENDWYDYFDPYDCCDGENSCTCQDQEFREHFCHDGDCDFDVTDNRTVTSGCTDCTEESFCSGFSECTGICPGEKCQTCRSGTCSAGSCQADGGTETIVCESCSECGDNTCCDETGQCDESCL